MTFNGVIKQLLQTRQIPINLKQISISSSKVHPSRQIVAQSAQFLKEQIAQRLIRRHVHMEKMLPKEYLRDITAVDRLSRNYLQSCEYLLSMPELNETDWEHVTKFTSDLQRIRESLDSDIESAMQSLQSKYLQSKSQQNEHLFVDKVLDSINLSVIGLRVLVTELKLLHNRVESNNDSLPASVVNPNCKISDIIRHTAEDAQALCVEKLGDSVEVELKGDLNVEMVCVESHIYFMLMELLKNSMRALLDLKNQMKLKNDEPIKIFISSKGKEIGIRVSDAGGGVNSETRNRRFRYFFSTAPQFEPNYTYSGNFGAPFTGLGCGLAISRLYARYMGGDLHVESLPGYGTDIYVYLDRTGTTGDIDQINDM